MEWRWCRVSSLFDLASYTIRCSDRYFSRFSSFDNVFETRTSIDRYFQVSEVNGVQARMSLTSANLTAFSEDILETVTPTLHALIFIESDHQSVHTFPKVRSQSRPLVEFCSILQWPRWLQLWLHVLVYRHYGCAYYDKIKYWPTVRDNVTVMPNQPAWARHQKPFLSLLTSL